MIQIRTLALLLLLCSPGALVQAHSVEVALEHADAIVVTLRYGDGRPFAHQRYSLTPAGAEKPLQSGVTDAHGRIVFLPGTTRDWQLKASSADGHGVKRTLVIPPPPVTATAGADIAPPPRTATPPAAPETSAACGQSPWLTALTGIGLLFGSFGLYQLFGRRKS